MPQKQRKKRGKRSPEILTARPCSHGCFWRVIHVQFRLISTCYLLEWELLPQNFPAWISNAESASKNLQNSRGFSLQPQCNPSLILANPQLKSARKMWILSAVSAPISQVLIYGFSALVNPLSEHSSNVSPLPCMVTLRAWTKRTETDRAREDRIKGVLPCLNDPTASRKLRDGNVPLIS